MLPTKYSEYKYATCGWRRKGLVDVNIELEGDEMLDRREGRALCQTEVFIVVLNSIAWRWSDKPTIMEDWGVIITEVTLEQTAGNVGRVEVYGKQILLVETAVD